MKKQFFKTAIITLLVFIQLNVVAQNMEDAVVLSHNGKYEAAEKIFIRLISEDEKNTSLLVASGFNNAWAKNYAAAKNRFNRALQLEPANTDAAKGLAYTYLYKGAFSKAASAFEKLVQKYPASTEYRIALALAYMNLQKKNRAQAQFEKVLAIDGSNSEAKKYDEQIKSGKGILELSALGGFSGSDDVSKFGLRQIQVGYHVNNEVFVYGRYDNSLAQDNYFFLKNNFNSNGFVGGAYARWHRLIGSKFEYGYRTLPGSTDQNIYQTEQIIFLPKNFSFKFGGSIITARRLQDEWMMMGGISIPAGKKIKIEPNYYFVHRLYNEHRFLLNISYAATPKSSITAGLLSGSEKNTKTNLTSNVFAVYAYSNFHIKGAFSGLVLGRYEKDAFDRNTFIAAAGFRIALDTKRF